MEDVDIGLKETVVQILLDFDECPQGPPVKKARRQKSAIKREWEWLTKEVRNLLLYPIATYCLDVTRSKWVSHANPLVKEFALSFEPLDVLFIVNFLRNGFVN